MKTDLNLAIIQNQMCELQNESHLRSEVLKNLSGLKYWLFFFGF